MFEQATPRCHQVFNRLVAPQRGLDGQLCRYIGAQAHVGEHFDALDQVLRAVFGAADNHPAGTVAGGTVVLGQAVIGKEQHVIRQ